MRLMRRVAVILLSALMMFAMQASSWAFYYDEGNDGDTEATAYVIDSLEDFIMMRDRVNNGTESEGKYYRLGANLDYNCNSLQDDWSIGEYDYPFKGHFNGNGKTIHISYDNSIVKEEGTNWADVIHTMSLFGYIESSGTAIKNLNLTGSITISSTSVYHTGGELAGLAYTLTSGIIENCTFTGSVEASFTHTFASVCAAGLVHDIEEHGIVRNCTFSGTVRAYKQIHQEAEDPPAAGGIALTCRGVIENCKVLVGSIVSANGYLSCAGGITGGFSQTSSLSRISGCTSNASIEDAEYNGGIIGLLYYTGGEVPNNLNIFGNTFTGAEQAIGFMLGIDSGGEFSGDVDPTYEFNGHKYRVFKESLTWQEAREKCAELGGHLATITSEEENNFIISLCTSTHVYWLGGYRSGSLEREATWYWITGEPFSFTQWHKGEPSGEEGYLQITDYPNPNWDDGWGWNDQNIDSTWPSPSLYGYICEWDEYTPATATPTLDITMLERRAKTGDPLNVIDNAPPNFYAERMYPDDNIICSMDERHYYDIKNNPVTEASIAELFKDEGKVSGYVKKGFTADGNTRLIIRALTDRAGKFTFSAPSEIGVVFESMGRYRDYDTSEIDIRTTAITSTDHQAAVVMISPKDFPQSLITQFPKSSFKVTVTFTPDYGIKISEDVNVEIHAVPVVLIHGFGRDTTVDNTFGDENAHWGIHRRLLDAGFRVYPCNYDSKLGPLSVIPDATIDTYEATPIFVNFAEALNSFARDTDSIACTKVDVVAHSMGGLMSRRFIQDDIGNLNTVRSYQQGMVRRLVTVGTPHEGSPYANWLLWNQFPLWTTRLNPVDAALSFKLTEFRGLVYHSSFSGTDDALRNFAIGSRLFDILREPSVPVYALHGKITGQKWEKPSREEYESKYLDALPLQFWLPAMDEFEYELNASKEDFSDWFVHTEMYSKTQLRVVFGANEEDCDGCVASSSATSIFKDNSEGFTGWRFWHSSICHQNETGDKVVSLLKGKEEAFKTFTSTSNRVARNSASPVVTASDTLDSTDYFPVHFTLTVDSVLAPGTLRVTTPGSIKIKATADEDISHRVYAMLNTNTGSIPYQLVSTDTRNFEGEIEFSDDDAGTMTIFCLSPFSGDMFYTSDTINLVIAPNLNNITGLNFPGYMRNIFTNVSSEVGISVFAKTSDGRKYNVALPSLGTTWTAEDSSIARVTNEGRILGLKEGATVLTATNGGFSASVNVLVGPALAEASTESAAAPSITTASLPSGRVGESYTTQLQASGTSPITWRLDSGELPGLTFNTSGLLSGTPTRAGTFTLNVTASNDAGQDTATLTMTVAQSQDPEPSPSPTVTAPSITTSSIPEGTAGTYYSASLYASGTRPITFALVDGVLPRGLSFSSGTISGTPEVSGSFTFTVRAANSAGSTQRRFTLIINASSHEGQQDEPDSPVPPSITTSSLPSGTKGSYYSAYISASGTQPITLRLTDGRLPEGLSFSGGYITGTPSETGTFTFTIAASNSAGRVEANFTIIINENLSGQDTTPEPAQDSEPETVPDIIIGRTRGISSLSTHDIDTLSNDAGMIASILPELHVNTSGSYNFRNVAIASNVPAGLPLVWNGFASGLDNSRADFFNAGGASISTVPQDHVINITAYLEAGETYAPVITVTLPNDDNADSHPEGSGSGGGGGCDSGLAGIIIAVLFFAALRKD